MGESKKSKIILSHFIRYIFFSSGVAIFAIAMLWLLDFYMFDRHRLVVSNTSGSDVEVLSASVNGVVIRDEVVFVRHNSKPHFSSTDYSEFKLRSKAGRFDVALTLRERGGGVKVAHCNVYTSPHTSCFILARYAEPGILRCVCEFIAGTSL